VRIASRTPAKLADFSSASGIAAGTFAEVAAWADAVVLAADTVASLSVQWGNMLLPMVVVWCFGSVIIHTLGRFHITLTYVTSFIAFALVRALVTGHPFLSEVAPITGPMYQRWDISAAKRTRLWGRTNFEFRADLINAFNHPNFTPVISTSTNADNYRITGVQENSSRIIQLVTRFSW